jgi:GNAT superfamily N-acetyltransferase
MRTHPERPHEIGATSRIRRARAADVPRLAWVRTASWKHAYVDIIDAHTLDRITRGDVDRMRRAVGSGHVWLVEDAEGLPFGYAWIGPQTDRTVYAGGELGGPFLGEVYELYLHPQWQRRGAGTKLLTHAIWQLVNDGLNPPMLWVLGLNDARHFYESTGGVAFDTRQTRVGARILTKVAYGWHEQLPLPR